DGDDEVAGGGGGIRPEVMKRTEAGTGLADRIDDVEQVPRRAREAVEAGDNQDIAGFQPADHLRQLGPVSLRARGLLFENVAAAGGLQLGDLAGKVLVPRRHPCISESSHFLVQFRKRLSDKYSIGKRRSAFCGKTRWCGPGPYTPGITIFQIFQLYPASRSWRQPPAGGTRPRLV